jgi:hypothetical protein
VKTPLPKCHGLVGYTEAQMIEYGKAEFDRAVLLAMNATRAFGKTGDVIAVVIGHIKRDEA